MNITELSHVFVKNLNILIDFTFYSNTYITFAMGGVTLSPVRPGPHQIFNKMTSGPHQK